MPSFPPSWSSNQTTACHHPGISHPQAVVASSWWFLRENKKRKALSLKTCLVKGVKSPKKHPFECGIHPMPINSINNYHWDDDRSPPLWYCWEWIVIRFSHRTALALAFRRAFWLSYFSVARCPGLCGDLACDVCPLRSAFWAWM